MAKSIAQNSSRWTAGQSGNPKGRPPKQRMLTDLLRIEGEKSIVVGGEEVAGQEALAKAVWQFALTGEVWLSGKRLVAESVKEWASVVKWLYMQVEPPTAVEAPEEPEVVVRVVRVEAPLPDQEPSPPSPLPQREGSKQDVLMLGAGGEG
jgi:hypothetical protein